MDRVNFAEILDLLGGESKTVIVAAASHWACGWVETILIHESDAKALKIGDEIKRGLKDYPLVDEDAYYEAQAEEREELMKDYLTEFRRETVLAIAELTDVPLQVLEEVAESGALDAEIASALYDAEGYSGEAWVCAKSFKRYATEKYTDSKLNLVEGN
jgi:hypothetical protein